MPNITTQAHSDSHETMSKNEFSVTVVYNGLPQPIDANPQAAVQALVVHSIHAFGIPGQPNLALYTEGNAPLDVHRSLQDQGIPEGATLVLRPVQVAAGEWAAEPADTTGKAR